MAGKETFFLPSCSATRRHLLDFTMAQSWKINAPLPAKTSPLPMASGYKNHVQHACPLQHSQGTQTSEQPTQPIYWGKEFNQSQSLIFYEKENGTSGSLSELTASVPVNSPSTSSGFFFFKHHKVSTSRYAEEGTRCHWQTLTRGIHGALLRWWHCSNVFVMDGRGIKQRSLWKCTADLL